MIKNCIRCRKSFDARGTAKTCSSECSKAYHRTKMKLYMKMRYQTPEDRERIKAKMKKYMKTRYQIPECRERVKTKMKERMKERYHTPEGKAEKQLYDKEYRQTPEYKARMKAYRQKPEYKAYQRAYYRQKK